MSLFHKGRKFLTTLMAVLLIVTATACGGTTQATKTNLPSITSSQGSYAQLERGNTAVGQEFGNWVVQTASGLVNDAYLRDNDKLGVVITPQVKPTEVKTLTRSLMQGFQHNFPNRDLKVLVYAPDKQLILTANYNDQTHQIQYQ